MTLTEFRDALDRFGPELDAWPAALIEDALDLMTASDAAKDAYAEAMTCVLEATDADPTCNGVDAGRKDASNKSAITSPRLPT